MVVAQVGEDLLTQRQARLLFQAVNRKEAQSCKQETENTCVVEQCSPVTELYELST